MIDDETDVPADPIQQEFGRRRVRDDSMAIGLEQHLRRCANSGVVIDNGNAIGLVLHVEFLQVLANQTSGVEALGPTGRLSSAIPSDAVIQINAARPDMGLSEV